MDVVTAAASTEIMLSVEAKVIYALITALFSAIVFMSGGFIYIYKRMEKKLTDTEEMLMEYLKEHTKMTLQYADLKSEYDRLMDEHRDLLMSKRGDN